MVSSDFLFFPASRYVGKNVEKQGIQWRTSGTAQRAGHTPRCHKQAPGYKKGRAPRFSGKLSPQNRESAAQPTSLLGSHVTSGGNTAHRTVTSTMMAMKGTTPL